MEYLGLAVVGLAIGCVSGMIGIGGGVLLIPALTGLFGLKWKEAAGVTLAVLAIPVTLPGVWAYYAQGHLTRREFLMAGCIVATFAVGTFTGAYLAPRDVSILRVVFGLLMLYVAVRLIIFSNNEAVNAAAGLVATATAWLGFLGLRALGRRHSPPRSLGEQIRGTAEQSSGPPDYII